MRVLGYSQLWLGIELGALALAAPPLLFPHTFGATGVVVAFLAIVFPYIAAPGVRALRTPLEVPILILLGMAILGAAIAVDASVGLPRLLGLLFAFAAYFTTVCIGLRLGHQRVHLLAWFLLLQGIGIALIGLVATRWEVAKGGWLGPIYERLPPTGYRSAELVANSRRHPSS